MRVLGHNRARPTRCSQSTEKWCSPRPQAGARQTSLFLGTAPEVVPAPLGSPVWAVPAQCEFQTVAASLRACQQVPSALPSACSGSLAGAHLIIRSQLVQAHLAYEGLAGWNIPTPPSTVTSNPPSDIFNALASISDSLHAPCCTHPHRNPQTTVAAARSNPLHLSTGTFILPVSTLQAWPRDWFEHLGAGGPREHSLNSPASPPLSRTKSSLSAI